MYYCKECGYEFEKPDKNFENHGFSNPPYEKTFICPACKSTNFYKIITTHCRCCGAKLAKGISEYCSKACKEKGEKMWNNQLKRKKILLDSPINKFVKELEIYNKQNGTSYSYGQYAAIIKPQQKAEKKCTKKRKNI